MFGLAEVSRGLFPLGGSTVRLQRQIGYAAAIEVLLMGDHIPSPRALLRWVSSMGSLPDGTARRSRKIAEKIARNAPSLGSSDQEVGAGDCHASGARGPEDRARIGLPIFGTEDSREGTKAFAERREPTYKGK